MEMENALRAPLRGRAAEKSRGSNGGPASGRKRSGREAMELCFHLLFLLCGVVAVAFVLFISLYLIVAGLPAIREIGLVNFLFGKTWAPTATTVEPSYGILPFILTSVYGTAGAVLIGVPIGLMTAVFLAQVAPPRAARVIKTAVELLAGIPSVVYGLVGMIVLVPAIRKAFGLSSGACLLAAIVVLGVGRAIGEAMAIIMVAGNVANMPGLFTSVRFLTTAIASEMSYAAYGSLQRNALYSIGLVLFLFIMLINVLLNVFIKNRKED